MFRSFRVALFVAMGMTLSGAGESPDRAVIDSTPVQLAALTPAPMLPLVTPNIEEDDKLVAPETSDKPETSLRSLVSAIADLPSVEMSKDLRCLATAVYFESKGEPLEGQLAVAQVIMNRVSSGRFANDICGVVYQPGQFSFTWDRHPDTPRDSVAWRTAQAVAVIAATDNWREVAPEATHFHAARVSPGWHNLRKISRVGNHIFYR